MKQIIASVLIVVVFGIFLLSVQSASAHVLATDKNIGAVLHIDPDDDPIAGAQSSFFFEFKDKQGKFSPALCDCTFRVLENGSQIYARPLFQNNTDPSLQNASVFYTFPKRDVYQIQVIGKPLQSDTFAPFVLSYDIRVERVSTPLASSPLSWVFEHMTHVLIIGGGIVLVLFLLWRQQGKKHEMKGGEKHDEKDRSSIY